MDVLAAISYNGQELFFLDQERYAHSTGKGIYIYDTVKGPREVIWRHEKELQYFVSNYEAQLLALSFKGNEQPLELVRLSEQNSPILIPNIVPTSILSMDISRTGDRLAALSDVTDHRIVLWSIADKTVRPLAQKKIDIICKKILINPVDINHMVAFGPDGVVHVYLLELFNSFTLKTNKIFPSPTSINGSGDKVINTTAVISTCVWLPYNRLLVMMSDGGVFELFAESRKEKFLGHFIDPFLRTLMGGTILIPTCAVISSSFIIIGTTIGTVYWFHLDHFLSETNENTTEQMKMHSREMKLNQRITSLTIDPTYSVLIIGTMDGNVIKANVDPEVTAAELDLTNLDKEGNEAAALAAEQAKKLKSELVPGVSLGNDSVGGVVLASKFLTIAAKKVSSRAKSYLSTLFLGSHDGHLTMWRHTAAPGDMMNPASGVGIGSVRRSIPRAMKELLRITTRTSTCAICSVEVITFAGHISLLCLGLESGVLEIWTIIAAEHDEEDPKELGPEVISKQVEDDEGSCVLLLEASFLLHTKVFDTAISSLTVLQHMDLDIRLAVGSADDPTIFILNIVRNSRLEIGKAIAAVDCLQGVNTMTVMDECVYAFGPEKNHLHRNLLEPNMKTHAPISTELRLGGYGNDKGNGIQSLVMSPLNTTCVIINTLGIAYFGILSDDAKHRVLWEKTRTKKLTDHQDLVCCAAFAPHGLSFATGTIDGTVYIYKVDEEGGRDAFIVNSIALHAHAIVTMVFSTVGTTLFSSSVDGSSLVLFVGKPNAKNPPKVPMHAKNVPINEELLEEAEFDKENEFLLKEKLAKEHEAELRAQHKFKCMGISAAVGEIKNRLHLLIHQNEQRSELEKLPREEFVIDLEHMQLIQKENHQKSEALRQAYFMRGKWLDLLSARLRVKVWDPLAVTGTVLRPFAIPHELEVNPLDSEGISSLPVPQCTSEEGKQLEKVLRLRRLEIRAIRRSNEAGSIRRIRGSNNTFRCAWAANVSGCPPDASYLVNDGLHWALHPNREEAVNESKNNLGDTSLPPVNTSTAAHTEDAEDENSLASMDNEELLELDEHLDDLLNLLYAPQTARTIVQKRNQMLMLREIVRRGRNNFNSRWEVLRKEKEELMETIQSRNQRIAEILDDFNPQSKEHLAEFGEILPMQRFSKQIWQPTLFDDEHTGSALKVSDSELKLRPYESEAAKAMKRKEAEEKARRAQQDANEVIKARALQDMMHGTLEVKRDVLAEALTLQRPHWISLLIDGPTAVNPAVTELPPGEKWMTMADLNETQRKEYDNYLLKLRALQEEQAHYRKALEQEMKKLKQEIVDVCRGFNDKLDLLSRDKVLALKEVLTHELYIAQISYSVVKAEQMRGVTKRSKDQLQQMLRDKAEVKAVVDRYSGSIEEVDRKIARVQEEGRNMDNAFKRDLQALCGTAFDQETLNNFKILFRKRPRDKTGGGDDADDNYGDGSNIDVSASQSRTFKRSKDVNSSSRHGASKGGGGGGRNASSRRNNQDASAAKGGGRNNRLKASKNVSASAGGGGGGGGGGALGPMQQAAQALRALEAEQVSYKEKDPFNDALNTVMKKKKSLESALPSLVPLSMEWDLKDMPPDFAGVQNQFFWSKLQDLRTAKIEKEIEEMQLQQELNEAKSKLQLLHDDGNDLEVHSNEVRARYGEAESALTNLDNNLDLLVALRQGQDEVDRDAVATDYTTGLLLPVTVIGKFNNRIKELGADKIAVLSKIKLFRRKINAIDWEAKHQALNARHYESYYTDLQLFRVTRDLQKVILEGENAFNQKDRVEKIAARKEYLLKEYANRHAQLEQRVASYERQLQEKQQELAGLQRQINDVNSAVELSLNIKKSKEQARGSEQMQASAALDRMKKVVNRKHLVDMARAQAEEIDFLRQELDRMRQRTFPSFVK